jgi:hypothetical protein
MSDDFFDQLNAEIAQITAKSKLKADATKLKKAANNMRLPASERQAALAEFRSIQSIVEADLWRAVKIAALFTEQKCDGCGSIHYNFLQYMLEEQMIKHPTTIRWTRVPIPPKGLARCSIIQPLATHVCADCGEDHGFNPQTPEVRLLPAEGGLTVSATYQQGDINGPSNED